jgi:hypothetical protein
MGQLRAMEIETRLTRKAVQQEGRSKEYPYTERKSSETHQ